MLYLNLLEPEAGGSVPQPIKLSHSPGSLPPLLCGEGRLCLLAMGATLTIIHLPSSQLIASKCHTFRAAVE